MHSIKTYLCGTTVRLTGDFYNFNGEPIDVEFVKVIIYNHKHEIVTEIPIGLSNKLGVGKYFYDYITPKEEKRFIYEFVGESDGLPSLNRGSFITKFIK